MKALQRPGASMLSTLAKLTQKKFRREEGRYLIEGTHLIAEALACAAPLEALLATAEAAARPECAELLNKAGSMRIPLYAVSAREADRLADAVTAQGILAVVSMKKDDIDAFWPSCGAPAIVIALEHVADPGNAGTIIRTAAWFGASAVLLSAASVELHNPKVLRSTQGAVFQIPVFDGVDFASALSDARANGFQVVVTALEGGKPFDRQLLAPKTLLVFGSEADGVSGATLQAADAVVTIPRFGHGESLNVASSCAAILGSVRLP